MSAIDPALERYIEEHTSKEDEILSELNRKTYLDQVHPQMIAGHYQGKILEMFSRMIRPEVILEIGTFTGYSAICLAKGLQKNGHLYTIEINEEQKDLIESYINKAGLSERISLLIGDAREIIPELPNKQFDLIYIDAEKDQYSEYFQLVIERLKPGGFIIADNVLWGGKILDVPDTDDKFTRGIQEFNDIVKHDHGVENVLLTVRDGLMLIRKCES